ncbi:MAG: sarcosine oxidase subunit delta [Gammaproteobacteria bacterium]|nr:sarcosine oxidase subunit delta [Gammaproteobacteria bacterium]
MQLHCPFCGPRQVEEFHCRGQVAESDDAVSAVYERVNRMDHCVEYWQHESGCRQWLQIRRNPSTGEVLEIQSLDSLVKTGSSE